jgi:hypothetical protein
MNPNAPVPEEWKDFIPEMKSMGELLRITQSDLDWISRLWRSDPSSQFYARTFIRTFTASVEGMSFMFRRMALQCSQIFGVSLSPGEIALLREERYRLDKSGTIQTSEESMTGISRVMRFSFATLAKALLSDFELAVDHDGFRAFQAVVEIRNRLTHPKRAEEMEIRPEDRLLLQAAAKWYGGELKRFVQGNRFKAVLARSSGGIKSL